MTEVDRWQRITDLFQAALDQPDEDRDAWLDEACAGNADLRAQLAEMLKLHESEDPLLDDPPTIEVVDGGSARASSDGAGEMVGHYKLLKVLGEGGMGVVWLAEQTEPVRRKVALKILKAGMDTKQVLARFEMERNVLAMMDHPGIARVYDAGETEQGRSFFVMEYVEGVPIHEFCDMEKLTTDARLHVFMQACDAVHHAHQKGVIHRDVKPSNILVILQDGRPVPKVIDFGIAKATGVSLTERTLFTETGQMIGTPEYMSPEQSEMTGIGVDTTTDIYSLGVVLYQLLAGVLPFDPETLRSKGIVEIQRIIHEEEPDKPSTRLSTLGDSTTGIVRQRRTDAKTLRRELKGDLDWITMKAMEKERTRRYASAHGLAADIRRHLDHEPVIAGPPSAMYRVGKFVRRNRGLVAAAAIVVLVLVAGIVTSTTFAAGQARARAEAAHRAEELAKVTEFQQSMLSDIDRWQMGLSIKEYLREEIEDALGRGNAEDEAAEALLASFDAAIAQANATSLAKKVIEGILLARAVETIERDFADELLLEAALRHAVGVTYGKLDEYESAEPHLERAMELRKGELGREHVATLDTANKLATVYHAQGRYDEAEPLYDRNLEIQKQTLGPEHADTLVTMNNLGLLYRNTGRYDKAESFLTRTLRIREQALGEEHRDTAMSMNNLGLLYVDQRRFDEAVGMFTKAHEIQSRLLGEEHRETLMSLGNLAIARFHQGRLDEVETLFAETLEIRRGSLGIEHPDTLTAMNNLAFLYAIRGRTEDAERLYLDTIEMRGRVIGADHRDTLGTVCNLAVMYRDLERYDKAVALFEPAIERARRALGDSHEGTGELLWEYGRTLAAMQRHEAAEAALLEAIEVLSAAPGQATGLVEVIIDLYDAWHEAEPDQGCDAEAEKWRAKLPGGAT